MPLNATLDWFGYHHLLGDQRHPAGRPQLRNEQRNDLGHSNGLADDGDNLHDLGEQHGRFHPRPPSRLPSTTRRPVRSNTTQRTTRGRTTPRSHRIHQHSTGNGSTWTSTHLHNQNSGEPGQAHENPRWRHHLFLCCMMSGSTLVWIRLLGNMTPPTCQTMASVADWRGFRAMLSDKLGHSSLATPLLLSRKMEAPRELWAYNTSTPRHGKLRTSIKVQAAATV